MPSSDPYLPDDYSTHLIVSLTASCAFHALAHSLADKPKEQADLIKEDVLKCWRGTWMVKFQEDMKAYNDLLASGKIKGAVEQLPSPEEYQEQFNRTVKEVEESARAALWPEEVKS